MTNRAWKILWTALVFAAAGELSAQQAPTGVVGLTIDEAIARGVEASHRIEELGARTEAASAVLRQRHASTLPQMSALVGYTRTNHIEEFGVLTSPGQFRVIYPDVPDNVRTRLDVQWPVYTGGRQQAIERAARSEAAASVVDVDALRADLRLEVARVYWSYVTAIGSARVVREALVRTDSHLVDARNLLDAGLIAPNDVLAVEAQQARQVVMRIRADALRDSVESELRRLVGVPDGTRIQPLSPARAEGAEPPFDALDTARDQLVAEARKQRRDRAALAERLAAAGALRDVAAAGLRPTVSLGGGVVYARPNPNVFPRRDDWEPWWDASVNVSWPIIDGGRARAEVAEASAGVRALQARLTEFDSILTVEIDQRVNDVMATRAAIVAAESAVRAAAEARRVAADRFTAGVASSTDVLDAQGAVLQAELDRTQALADARLAEARLVRSLGR
jgi:outer membrane protein TolC